MPDRTEALEHELATALQELSAARERIRQLELASDLGERLVEAGSFVMDWDTMHVRWSDNNLRLNGVSREEFGGTYEDITRFIHPDDRADFDAKMAHVIATRQPYTHTHRIVRPNGEIRHVREVAETLGGPEGKLFYGITQDITEFIQTKTAEQDLQTMIQLAGEIAKVGGWRVDLGTNSVVWSQETARIHDEPAGTSPTLEQALDYYTAADRERIRSALATCAEQGHPFNEVLELVTARGRQLWIRSIGEAVHDERNQIVAVQGAIQDISDLVAARNASENLSSRLQNTLENISDAFFLLDSDWCFAFVNGQAELLLQQRREKLLGRNIWQVFPEAADSAFPREYDSAVASGESSRFQEYFAPLAKWIEVVANPTAEGLAVYCRDITEKRHQESQLRLLETAVAHQNDILLITDAEPIDGPEGPRIIYVNDAFERRTGFSRSEVIGQTPRILQGPRTQRAELDRIRAALRDWQPVRAELINYTKSGEEFWLELDIVPLADEQGWFTHWVAIERDITDRKQIQQALQLNEQRFRLIAKASGNVVWEWNLSETQNWWSEGMLEVFGHDPGTKETLATLWDDNIHPDDKARVNAALEDIQRGNQHILQIQHRFRRGDGSWANVENRAFAVTDDDGQVIRILGCMTDISERLQFEERLRQTQRMEAVGQLTGGVAHDFNNLLTVLLGNAEILAEELADQPQLQKLAGMSIEAADKGAELVSRLLAFSRKQTLASRILDVGQVVQGMDSLLRRTLPASLALEIGIEGGLWKIDLDSAQLESALLNLALNARDAMPAGGCLSIGIANVTLEDEYAGAELVASAGQYVMITVTDTGHGIAPDLIDRIFEPFFTTKEVGKGSGLGLSMVYGFVKQSGGHIRVESQPGRGTSFKLFFPRSPELQEQTPHTPPSEMAAGGRETILVVEDDKLVRGHVTGLLKGIGYRVFEASSGSVALEIMQQTSGIDLLFTDVVMPGGMGGAELADSARRLQPDLKILFTSGYTEDSIVHHGRLDPGTVLLGKPYRRDELAAKVRAVLDQG